MQAVCGLHKFLKRIKTLIYSFKIFESKNPRELQGRFNLVRRSLHVVKILKKIARIYELHFFQ
jgi:hypothetical protein